MKCHYVIQITRNCDEFIASIPELCIAENGATPQEALSAALQAEERARKSLGEKKISLPPNAALLDPFPKVTRWIARKIPFFAKVVVGYVLVLCLTAALFIIVFPTLRAKVENYVVSGNAAISVEKVFSKLGISSCLEKP